jgi:CheY-like chemotaxis protein
MTKDEISRAADMLNEQAKNMPTVPSGPWRAMLDGAEAIRQLQAENEALKLANEFLRNDAERLRRHAVTLAATAEAAERERCAKVCDDYAVRHAKDDDDSKARAWMMLQCGAEIRKA